MDPFTHFQEGKLVAAREIVLSAEQDNEEVRSKLEMPTSTTGRHTAHPFAYGRNWMRATKEPSITGSSISSVDLLRERAEEEVSTVRSSRSARTKRTSEELYFVTDESSKHRSRHEVIQLPPLLYRQHLLQVRD